MTDSNAHLLSKIEQLEHRLRRVQWSFGILAGLVAGALAITSVAEAEASSSAEEGVLRTGGIVIVDANGRERIHIGAPVPSPAGDGPRISPSTGMTIHDKDGRERFGVGLMENGQMNMGFDGAPGTGDDRNRERLNLGVTADGRGYIRFLNRATGLAGGIHLDDQDDLAFELWDSREGHFARGRLDIEGWQRLPDYPKTR